MDFEYLLTKAKKEGIKKFLVGGVIFIGNKVLLVQRAADDFMGGLVEIPSGKIDTGETIEEALIREVFEETGLKIKRVKNYIGSFDYLSSSGKESRQMNFLLDIEDGKIKLNPEEHSAYFLVTKEDISNYNISKKCMKIVLGGFDLKQKLLNK